MHFCLIEFLDILKEKKKEIVITPGIADWFSTLTTKDACEALGVNM